MKMTGTARRSMTHFLKSTVGLGDFHIDQKQFLSLYQMMEEIILEL
jgi:hypothetical protein